MAEVHSSISLIAAVLQTAGYYTQELFLDRMQDFFNHTGAFIYTISIIGGVISYAIFGSYRAVRYLLIGPALFWFLVGARAESDGVIWKIGNGSPRTAVGPVTSDEAAKAVREMVDNTKDETSETAVNKKIRISSAFNWFSQVIDTVTETFVAAVLQHEDDEDLNFVYRVRAFEILLNSKIANPDLLQMFESSLFGNCQPMMAAATALSDPIIAPRFVEDLKIAADQAIANPNIEPGKKAAAIDSYVDVARKRDHYQEEYLRAQSIKLNPNPTTRKFMYSHRDKGGATEEFLRSHSEYKKDSESSFNSQQIVMTCGEHWQIVSEGVMEHAEEIWRRALGEDYQMPLGSISEQAKQGIPNFFDLPNRVGNAVAKEKLCEALATKLGRKDQDHCDLTEAVAMFLVAETIKDSKHSQYVQRAFDQSGFRPNHSTGSFMTVDDKNNTVDPIKIPRNAKIRTDSKTGVHQVYIPEKDQWQSYVAILKQDDQNAFDAGFKLHQLYQAKALRQGIFTYATQLPYFQGVLLFMIAAAYPFLSLIVLIPGRAQGFLYVPLAWFWIKSWDIGFALVMILDRVVWNMFPPGTTKEKIELEQLPNVMSQAFSVDPTYNVFGYYLFISVALFAVPALSGWAIMKGKKAILSSFTDGPRRQSNDAGDKASGAWGVKVMNERMQSLVNSRGLASLMRTRFQGIDSSPEQGQAMAWGAARGFTSGAAKGVDGAQDAGEPGKPKAGKVVTDTMADALEKGSDTYIKMMSAFAKREAKFNWAFHPTYGRWGTLGISFDASHAAMDGAGGFEINEPTVNAYEADISLFETKVGIVSAVIDDAAGAFGNIIGRNVNGILDGQIKDAAQGGATGGAGGAAQRVGQRTREQEANAELGKLMFKGIGKVIGYAPGLSSFIERLGEDEAKNYTPRIKVDHIGFGDFRLEKDE